MRVLVIGGSGFLGSHIGVSLDQHGFSGTSLSRRAAMAYDSWEKFESAQAVEPVLDKDAWDVVINTVAISSHEQCHQDPQAALEINASWPGQWAEMCYRKRLPFIHISTDAVFSADGPPLHAENSPVAPKSAYGRTKREGELRVLENNPMALVVRTNFFGWSSSGQRGILDFFYQNLRRGEAVTGFTDYITTSIYAGQLSEVLWDLVQRGAAGIFHVSSSSPMTKFEFGLSVAKEFNFEPSLIVEGSKDSSGLSIPREKFLALSNTRTEKVTHQSMPTTKSGLKRARLERELFMSHLARRRGEHR